MHGAGLTRHVLPTPLAAGAASNGRGGSSRGAGGVYVKVDDTWLPGGGGDEISAGQALAKVFEGGITGNAGMGPGGDKGASAWNQVISLNLEKAGADSSEGVVVTALTKPAGATRAVASDVALRHPFGARIRVRAGSGTP